MRNKILITSLILSTTFAFGFDLNAIKDAVKQKVTESTTTNSQTSTDIQNSITNLSDSTISSGLKEALKSGVTYAIDTLGAENGFLNSSVKIPLPENIAKIESAIRAAGGGQIADDLINSMNNAATQAAPKTAEIFLNAIDNMSLEDAQNILTGSNSAATDYFKANSQASLTQIILPIIQSAMKNNQVATYYNAANEFYKTNLKDTVENSQLISLAKDFKVDSFLPTSSEANLDEYITQKAIDGLFTMIQSKEEAIRTNPIEQTTAILKEVFGNF